ncbi:uroporphyrinogen-III synthase [Sanguibacter gelidistatuariae]|uniref:Uroporphyrinogen-III synthase n=1 Tax=Sanguibacter gelidistatuariae TaxID=1814289 RepID=A0A1G6HA78_9MICO|nr:uroporphyrinogen-III synthase [Sanguibacter gelidistatuariae]SDB90336.1 uroporphyrinogen-III synthase [Sanguibacter gelidistatuariae]
MTDTDPSALAGRHVLIPRAPGRGDGLARRVEAAGGVAVVAPLISRQAIDDAGRAALDDAVAQLADGAFAWVAVTSVNAVDELAASAQRVEAKRDGECRADDRSPAPSPLSRLAVAARWAVVGPATARALAAHGITADLVAPQNSATGMLAVWPDAAPRADRPSDGTRAIPSPRVLLPLGDLARPTLEHGLTTLGYLPVRVTAYRTVSHPAPPEVVARWRAGGFDAVVLTSGSVAREVAAQLGVRPDVLAVAIGEPTREAASGVGQVIASVAGAATDDALFAALLAAVGPATTNSSAPSVTPAAAPDPPASPTGLLDAAGNPAILEEGTHPSPRHPGVPHTPEES